MKLTPVANNVFMTPSGTLVNASGEIVERTGGKGGGYVIVRDPNGRAYTPETVPTSGKQARSAPDYTLGYDTELFPYYDDKWLEKNLPELKKELDQYSQAKRRDMVTEYFHRVGMPNSTPEQQKERDNLLAVAAQKYGEEAKNPSKALLNKFGGDTEAAKAYAAEQAGLAGMELTGRKPDRGLESLVKFAAIAAGMYGGITALGGAVSGGAGSGTLIGGAGADTLGVNVGTGTTATASSGTGISGWLSSTFGIPTGVTTTASAASTINDIAGVVSGGEGVASIGGAAASGASTFSQILSGVSTVGKIAGAAGSIFELVGGSGAADAYSTFLNADAAKAAATGKARDYNEQAESYDYLASQAGRNRQVSLQNYVAEQQRLAVESERIARATKRAIGSTTAAYGAAGVALESGSVQEVLMDSAAEGELDLAIENFNSKQRQRNYLIEADALAEEEAFNKKNAARARENANLSLEAGNSISDMLRKQGTVQGIEAGVNILKGVGGAVSAVNSLLDL